MHGAKSVAAMALLGLASAAPAPLSQANSNSGSTGGSFIVPNKATGNMIPRDGIVALSKAYAKYNIPTSEDWIAAVTSSNGGGLLNGDDNSSNNSQDKQTSGQQTGQSTGQTTGNNNGQSGSGAETGEVAAMPVANDVEYTSVVNIGGTEMAMDFDTGSSDLWVMNTNLPSSMSAGHTVFNPQQSSNFKQITGSSFSVTYGDNSFAKGNVLGTDTVNIGGAVVNNQVIELPSEVGTEFTKDTSSNGLVGLAFQKLNTVQPQPAKTFFENLVASNQLAQPVFTANLKHAATGAYEFGKIDSTQFTGTMQWVPIQNSGFWQFPSAYFSVGGGQLLQNTNASPAIADTGTSLLLMDQGVVETYYSAIPGAANTATGYVFPANANPPDLKISVGSTGSQMITIPGSLLRYTQSNATHVFGGLQSNRGSGTQILGDILFKSQFVAFDLGNNRVGFANHAN